MTHRDDRELWRLALRATSLGWDLALPIFGGVLIGYMLDRATSTRYVFTLGLLVTGIGVGFYNVIQSIRHLEERSRGQTGGASGEQNQEEDGTDL